MFEITCPFCDQACLVSPAGLAAERTVVRCDECSTETDLTDAMSGPAVALAA